MWGLFGKTVIKGIKIYFRLKINGKTDSESWHGTFQNACEKHETTEAHKGHPFPSNLTTYILQSRSSSKI